SADNSAAVADDVSVAEAAAAAVIVGKDGKDIALIDGTVNEEEVQGQEQGEGDQEPQPQHPTMTRDSCSRSRVSSVASTDGNENVKSLSAVAPHDPHEPCSSTAASSEYESSPSISTVSASGEEEEEDEEEEEGEEEDAGDEEDVFSKFDGEEIPMAIKQTAGSAADTPNGGPDTASPTAQAGQQEGKAGEGAGVGGVWADFGCTDGYGDGYGDSDAESEYTPEEAIEVLRRAAIRFSTAGSKRRESAGVASACYCLSPAASRVAGGISRAGSRSSSMWMDEVAREGGGSESVRRASLLSLLQQEAKDRPSCSSSCPPQGRESVELLGEENDGGADGEEAREEEEANSQTVIKMEKSFEKACTVLGIDMNKFFDTILESSLGNDVEEYSAIDSAAAVAAATAGIKPPHDSVVVTPRPLSAVLGKPGATAE
ncbi:unnamed protein product, partial [Scytosiphon promiscuus]